MRYIVIPVVGGNSHVFRIVGPPTGFACYLTDATKDKLSKSWTNYRRKYNVQRRGKSIPSSAISGGHRDKDGCYFSHLLGRSARRKGV